ncbi:uncharacterized protein LOC141631572 [Silene latifolia]|uniref:uncharacterized protein LOC141631572 n=1 Tax=Silene latifolia TaxID=37657 RepID=UPI003D76F8DA
MEMGSVSDWEKEKWLWNSLWKVPVWPRVKLFFWQLCNEALATRANIASLVRGCWALWEHRNKVIFDNREVDPWTVVWRAKEVMEETEGGGLGSGRSGSKKGEGAEKGRERWTAPHAGYVKINTDAGVKEGDGFSVGVEQRWEPQMAKAVAVLEGVTEAARRGHTRIVVESDCLSVIDALRRKDSGRNLLSLIYDDIQFLCSAFIYVSWSFTNRMNNRVAHCLAHLLPRIIGRSVWSDNLPPTANNAVIYDLALMK